MSEFKLGDKVVVTDEVGADMDMSALVENGDIGTIIEIEDGYYRVEFSHEFAQWLRKEHFELVGEA